jgi:hypothetical protein
MLPLIRSSSVAHATYRIQERQAKRFHSQTAKTRDGAAVNIKATKVTVPLEVPLRHANGCDWRRFVRTIVEAETDDGLGETGGADPRSVPAILTRMEEYL